MNQVDITIDNKKYSIDQNLTILQAAQQNDIYIPTLCAHKELSPYGGCRMCLVEVEGARGFLTACTTPVEQGMIVRTHTDQIQKERKEILELILTEHTSSCLICDEKVECKKAMPTIRKAGVTTGCRYCPNDGKCELEEVVNWLEINELNHPVYYRNLPVEKNDPFYDRDYNLCILCGRCVRICQEVRNANVLAFNQRGHNTVIGPAFGRTHIEANCEFCGACVSVCPTGALAEKASKWDGIPDSEIVTTCSLCGVGCQMRVLVKNNHVMGTLPAENNQVNDGHLCVKGRFCITELVNNYQRLKKPSKVIEGNRLEIKWDEAINIAAEKLSNCSPENFGMLISPNCTNEDLYVAQKFARTVMKSNNIDTSVRLQYGAGFDSYINLMKKSVPVADIAKSTTVLAIGLDMKYGRSVVGVHIRKAVAKGLKVITINPDEHSLSLTADIWLRPKTGTEDDLINNLTELIANKKSDKKNNEIYEAAEMLQNASNHIIIIGSNIFNYKNSSKIFELIDKLAEKLGAGIVPLPAQNNLYGSLMMGTYPELSPNGKDLKSSWNSENILSNKKLKIAYLIGEALPESEQFSDYIIYQNIYPPENLLAPDLVFPAAAFTEIDGTFTNGEGRIQQVNKAADSPGESLPDWQILCMIARKMDVEGFDFKSSAEINKEIASAINADIEPKPLSKEIKLNSISGGYEFSENIEHSYRGIPLTSKVEGLNKLFSKG